MITCKAMSTSPFATYSQKEREREDARIMRVALEKLAVEHRRKLADLKVKLREDAKKKKETFKRERVRQKRPPHQR